MGSSLQTHLLSYWVRARQAFTLEEAVRKLTFDNAVGVGAPRPRPRARGLRGGPRACSTRRACGRRCRRVETDLPGGARRLVQKAEGIAAIVVNGQVTLENGETTGRTPGVAAARARARCPA